MTAARRDKRAILSLDLRTATIATFAALLAALAGYASGRSPWHSSVGSSGAPQLPLALLMVLLGGFAAAALLVLWVETPENERGTKRRRAREPSSLEELPASFWSGTRAGLFLVALFGLVCLALWPLMTPNSSPSRPRGQDRAPALAPTGARNVSSSTRSGTATWLLIGAGGTLLALGPAALLERRRRAKHERASLRPDIEERFAQVVTLSLADLRSVADVREAIQRAYLRMEQSLEATEIVRARHETPSEFLVYVRRILGSNGNGASALTELFELARFSTHALGEEDRRHAIASLRELETGLSRR